MTLERYTPKQIADITKSTTKRYLDMPDYDAEAAGNAMARIDRLNEFAQRDLGLNLDHLQISLEAHEALLQREGTDPDKDPFIGFLREQIAFSQRMAVTVQDISSTSLQFTDYQRRVQAAKASEPEYVPSRNPRVFGELPDGFYKREQLERFLGVDATFTDTTHRFMAEQGVTRYRLDKRFLKGKRLTPAPKDMWYALHFWDEGEEEPPEELAWYSAYLGSTTRRIGYSEGGRRGRENLSANFVPLLIPKDRRRYGDISIDEAFHYFNYPGLEEQDSCAHIRIDQITEENIRKLLTVFVAGKDIKT